MSGEDLKYGWVSATFELRITGLYSEVSLEELDKDGDWSPRDHFDDDSEDRQELRYSRPQRFLAAKACPKQFDFRLIWPVPDDKKAYDLNQPFIEINDKQISSKDLVVPDLEFLIRENESDDENPANILRRGVISSQFAEVYVPKVTFDDIERIMSQQDITVDVRLNVKCWHHPSWVGSPDLYLNEPEGDRDEAELATLSVRKLCKHRSRREEGHDEQLIDNDSEPLLPPEEQRVWLIGVGRKLVSIQAAVWIIAVAVIVIAVTAFL